MKDIELPAGEAVSVSHYDLSAAAPVYVAYHTSSEMPLASRVHEGIEVGMVLQGVQERYWHDFSCVARLGDPWLCATWEAHGWRSVVPDTQTMVVIFLPGYLGDEMFGELSWLSPFAVPPGERPRADDSAKRERLLAAGAELLEYHAKRDVGWESGVRLCLLRMLFLLTRGWSPPGMAGASPGSHPAQLARIIPALTLVHTQPVRRVTVAEAAEVCSLSRAQFCLLFRQSLGMAFGKFCLHRRLAIVASRLLDTYLPLQALAEETDFSSASHLHRSFLQRYGCTPARYRARAQQTSATMNGGRISKEGTKRSEGR